MQKASRFQWEHIVTYMHFNTKYFAVSGQSKLQLYPPGPPKTLVGFSFNCVAQGWI